MRRRGTWVLPIALLAGMAASGQSVRLSVLEERAVFTEGVDTVLAYQIAPKAMAGKWERSGYIHPLYSLDGAVLTEDFPEDHPHHRGIFWAWHQLYIGDARIGDGWEIRDFSWEVARVETVTAAGDTPTLQATVFWKSPLWRDSDGRQKAFVEETTEIAVYPAATDARCVDLTIRIRTLEPDMRLGGSEDEKGYGGFSTRVSLPEDLQFRGPSGAVRPENTPVTSPGWIDITGSLGRGENPSGLVIVEHPGNPGYPNPWILRQSASMQNAVYPYPGAVPVALPQDHPLVLRYRLIIHRANADISTLLTDW